MSSIDQRVVQMKFDNAQFESGIKTSMNSINNLKQGLNMDSAVKSLSNLDRVGKSFSLAGIAQGVETLTSKFSALGIVGVTAIANIANTAVNMGKNIVSSLTIDPVKMGFDEYETKMNSIQTIMTNTASKGTTMNDVTGALEELNTYADQTIYNFAEMTRNIGTFTAAGIDLKTSTESIKGIANLAAGSGSNAQQASSAMYQLSQAMASGTVKLQDWNSVVNAGMGGELFQKALEQTATELGNGRNQAVSFRESLEDGWITTDVLTKTLQKFANDPSLLQAATQVKTFTQLSDTMKESVQSGWSKTWETIIGNKDEAAKVFTAVNDVFGGMINKSADARNAMLDFWKANGGRDKMIETISSAFNTLMSVMKPVGEAFREIFPAMTGQRLLEITESIHSLVTNFKIGDPIIANIKSTFKGLFALLDIGKQIIVAVGQVMFDLFKNLLPAGDGLLSVTANVGDFLVYLDESIKKSGFLVVAVSKISKGIEFVSDIIKTAMDKISGAFESFKNIDLSGVDAVSDKITTRFEPISKLGEIINKAFGYMAHSLMAIAPLFSKLATIVGGAFKKLFTNIAEAFSNADFKSIFDILNGGLFAAILLGVKKFISSLTSVTDSAGGFLGNITDILDGVKGSLSAYQSSLKAGVLLKIAISIGILAASLTVLSMIDSKKLTSAMAAMTGMFVELFGSMAIFSKLMNGEGFKGMVKLTFGMVGLSIAILLLSTAMTKLSKLDWDGIDKGLISIAILSAIMVKASKGLSANSKGLIKSSFGLILFATAINILVSAVERLSKLDVGQLAKGLIGVGILVTELSIFMNKTDLSKGGVFKSAGLMLLATSLLILSIAVERLGNIDTSVMIQGLIGIGALLTELAIFTKFTGNAKNVISTAIGLTILGSAMIVFSIAIEKMGSIPLNQIGKGLITMAGALTIITIAMKFMPKDIALKAIGLLILSSALLVLSNALLVIGGMSLEQIGKSLFTLAAGLTIIAIAMKFMKTGIPGAVAMLIMAGAIAVLTPCLTALGQMSLSEIGTSLLALAGAFAVLGIGTLLLTPLIPALFGLAAAIALFGVACLAVGAGVLLFSTGLTALSVAGMAGTAAIVAMISAIIGLIPLVLTTLAEGLISFISTIGAGAPAVGTAMLQVLTAILNTVIEITPKVMECLQVLITSFISLLVSSIPLMVDAGMQMIVGILSGIANNIGAIVSAAIDIPINFINGIASKIPDIIDCGFNLILSFINGLADSIEKNTPLVINAVNHLMTVIIDSAKQVLTDGIPSFTDIGGNIVDGLTSGISDGISGVTDAVCDLGDSALTGLKDLLGIHSPSRETKKIGRYFDLGLANGLSDYSNTVTNEAKNVGTGAIKSLKNSMSNLSSVLSGDVDMNPTIRPVMDISDISNGANAIDSMFNSNRELKVSKIDSNIASISSGMNSRNNQNGSNNDIDKTPVTENVAPKSPMILQLMLQNGQAISEYIIDDLDGLMGTKNKITGRMVGI